MESITLIIGIGIFMFVLSYLILKLKDDNATYTPGSKQGNKHFLLQLLLIFFLVFSTTLVGKVGLDDANYCDFLKTNETVINATTTYGYDYVCEENTTTTANTFYKLVLGFVYSFVIYVMVYFTYEVLVYLGYVVPK